MDEVDKIIIHSLKQIGCKIEKNGDIEVFRLKHFTPDLLVRAVSKCLREIIPDAVLPEVLPENIAQRFTVATTLAELCSVCGYRGDIGYQTFLYPNEVDIRRLFMFLIEKLPKEQFGTPNDARQDKNDFELLMLDIRKEILIQLKAPWVPQYCRCVGNRKAYDCNGLSAHFIPQLNLNIPKIEKLSQIEEQPIVAYQIPNIFQQTCIGDYDLISSVLHKNAIDMYSPAGQSIEDVRLALVHSTKPIIFSAIKPLANVREDSLQNQIGPSIKSTEETISEEIEYLKLQNQQFGKKHQTASIKLNQIQRQRLEIENKVINMRKVHKIHERTLMILENSEENINKLETLIERARERHLAVENQWQLHRSPALEQINNLKKIKESKNEQNMNELRSTIQQLQTLLTEKNHIQTALDNELKKTTSGVAARNEYTRRIYEFIGNIRKQRNDIYKILDDTKDLQKQLNSVSAQLHRQFNYTDDLLFQSAKHDLHAKQAYKFLASLHVSCNEICDLVLRTGQMAKESRDVEVQIDRERMRNVAASLEKITLDIQKFQKIIKTMNLDINQVENEIYSV